MSWMLIQVGPNTRLELGWLYEHREFYEGGKGNVWSEICSWGVRGCIVGFPSWMEPTPIRLRNLYFDTIVNQLLLTENCLKLNCVFLLSFFLWSLLFYCKKKWENMCTSYGSVLVTSFLCSAKFFQKLLGENVFSATQEKCNIARLW